jgi:ectoine hydroxylase-related dioxygenase (phytanoyl-CoA dioxygenase family)
MKTALKKILLNNPSAYKIALKLRTLNWHSFQNIFRKADYPSRFGGCWVDRKDYAAILSKKMKSGEITKDEGKLLDLWVKQGYLIFKNAIPATLVDTLNNELEKLKVEPDESIKITGNFKGSLPYAPQLVTKNNSVRIVDYYAKSQTALDIILNEQITRFLSIIFEDKPLVFQGLNFEYGSQQNIHQDTAYVVANEPMKLAAAWVALEDVSEGSGELIYYEGSHRLPEYYFSKHFKHFNPERDGDPQHEEWQGLLHTNSKKLNLPLRKFLPQKGDVLIWHADLAHGGAQITNNKTRRSFVGHYCPSYINPFYFNYLEKNRKKIKHKGGYYSSSHYELP